MWRLIKWTFTLVVVLFIVCWVKGYKIGGKTVPDYFRGIVGAKTFDEGIKDIRSLVGEAIKVVGDVITPEVTEDERKELEKLIKQEIKQEGQEPGQQKGGN